MPIHCAVSWGAFMATLHERGIYFRSAHLGNIVLTPEHQLGLIDIADMRVYRRPLRKTLRLRNFKHMVRYPQDRQWLLDGRGEVFIDNYGQTQSICSPEELSIALQKNDPDTFAPGAGTEVRYYASAWRCACSARPRIIAAGNRTSGHNSSGLPINRLPSKFSITRAHAR